MRAVLCNSQLSVSLWGPIPNSEIFLGVCDRRWSTRGRRWTLSARSGAPACTSSCRRSQVGHAALYTADRRTTHGDAPAHEPETCLHYFHMWAGWKCATAVAGLGMHTRDTCCNCATWQCMSRRREGRVCIQAWNLPLLARTWARRRRPRWSILRRGAQRTPPGGPCRPPPALEPSSMVPSAPLA